MNMSSSENVVSECNRIQATGVGVSQTGARDSPPTDDLEFRVELGRARLVAVRTLDVEAAERESTSTNGEGPSASRCDSGPSDRAERQQDPRVGETNSRIEEVTKLGEQVATAFSALALDSLAENSPDDRTVDLLGDPVEKSIDDRRERLRKRFTRVGSEALDDNDLLELVLYEAVPGKRVVTLAKRLMVRFGSFDDAISACPLRLAEVRGVDAAVIRQMKIVEAAAHRIGQTRVLGKDVVKSWSQLILYLRQRLACESTEQLRILYLGRKNMLIADEMMMQGTVDHVPVYPREIVKRALELQALALVLVHNHPSGDPTPSVADIEMTRKITTACATVGITVHDHVIVGRNDVVSFHEMGLLD